MPYYEYECSACSTEFSVLVRRPGEERPACEACGSQDLRRLLSSFGVAGVRRASSMALQRPGNWIERPEGFGEAMRALEEKTNVKLDRKKVESATERLRAAGEA